MVNNFNPTERDKERTRRTKVRRALQVLEEVEYLLEHEWNRLNEIRERAMQRDFPRWMKERGIRGIRKS